MFHNWYNYGRIMKRNKLLFFVRKCLAVAALLIVPHQCLVPVLLSLPSSPRVERVGLAAAGASYSGIGCTFLDWRISLLAALTFHEVHNEKSTKKWRNRLLRKLGTQTRRKKSLAALETQEIHGPACGLSMGGPSSELGPFSLSEAVSSLSG